MRAYTPPYLARLQGFNATPLDHEASQTISNHPQ
jgi:hypothetical protein